MTSIRSRKSRRTGAVLWLRAGAAALLPAGAGWAGDAGEILWQTRIEEATSFRQFIAVGPDGTIYTAGGAAFYAVNPDGSVRWNSPEAFGVRSISIGQDGTIYTGAGSVSGGDVVAFDPDGSVRWRFVPPFDHRLAAGPNVGPDGNIYAVQGDFAGVGTLGAFALSPDRELLWSNTGDPPLTSDTLITLSDVEFGADRLHFGFWRTRSGSPVTYTFDLGGAQLWETNSLRPPARTFPVVDPTSRVIASWGQTGMRALSPGGEEEWFALHPDYPNRVSVIIRPAIDPNGVIYTGDASGIQLWALDPDGSTRWVGPDEFPDGLSALAVPPDGSVLVAQATAGEVHEPVVRGYDPADGTLLWQADPPDEDGHRQVLSSYEPAFSPDSRTVYVFTRFLNGPEHGYLTAIALGGSCAADFDGDGSVTSDDYFTFLTAYFGGDADFNGNGTTDSDDYFAFLAAFFQGC